MAHFLEAIMGHLYGKDALEKENLEHCLKELCHLLSVKINPGYLTVERTKTESDKRTQRLFQYQVGYTRAYVELSCKQRRTL